MKRASAPHRRALVARGSTYCLSPMSCLSTSTRQLCGVCGIKTYLSILLHDGNRSKIYNQIIISKGCSSLTKIEIRTSKVFQLISNILSIIGGKKLSLFTFTSNPDSAASISKVVSVCTEMLGFAEHQHKVRSLQPARSHEHQ